ncbi:MAG: terpene cyclase/mutase family protein [Gammaproteobacteria bacterium]|jgi:prenyltransferase beta subunit
MGKRWLISLLMPLALLSGVVQSAAEEDGGARDQIDLQLTGALVERWATRPSFPESVTFAYYHVYMARALGQPITPERRKLITEYVAECQQPDGGFTPSPAHARTASVIYTWYALAALDLLGEAKAIRGRSAADFVVARAQPDGGIAATPREGDRANLATTYYGVESLRLLGALGALDSAKTTAFIQRYREEGRGFTRVEGGASTPQSTYMAVRVLKSLGTLTDQAEREIIDYLKDTRYSGLVEDRQYRLLPSIEAMAATLNALATLSRLDEIDSDKAYTFIGSLYVSVNGGFGPRPGLGTTPPSTYHAIHSLVRLGELPDPMAVRR